MFQTTNQITISQCHHANVIYDDLKSSNVISHPHAFPRLVARVPFLFSQPVASSCLRASAAPAAASGSPSASERQVSGSAPGASGDPMGCHQHN